MIFYVSKERSLRTARKIECRSFMLLIPNFTFLDVKLGVDFVFITKLIQIRILTQSKDRKFSYGNLRSLLRFKLIKPCY